LLRTSRASRSICSWSPRMSWSLQSETEGMPFYTVTSRSEHSEKAYNQ
jgi:hypothetical protein